MTDCSKTINEGFSRFLLCRCCRALGSGYAALLELILACCICLYPLGLLSQCSWGQYSCWELQHCLISSARTHCASLFSQAREETANSRVKMMKFSWCMLTSYKLVVFYCSIDHTTKLSCVISKVSVIYTTFLLNPLVWLRVFVYSSSARWAWGSVMCHSTLELAIDPFSTEVIFCQDDYNFSHPTHSAFSFMLTVSGNVQCFQRCNCWVNS